MYPRKRDVGDADDLGRGPLLRLPDAGDLRAGDRGVEAACVAVGDNAVRHLDAGLGPRRDGSGGPEVDVVGVGGDHQDAFDVRVR